MQSVIGLDSNDDIWLVGCVRGVEICATFFANMTALCFTSSFYCFCYFSFSANFWSLRNRMSIVFSSINSLTSSALSFMIERLSKAQILFRILIFCHSGICLLSVLEFLYLTKRGFSFLGMTVTCLVWKVELIPSLDWVPVIATIYKPSGSSNPDSRLESIFY